MVEFNSIEELKNRIMPALRLRTKELKKSGLIITEDELFNYLVDNHWKKAYQLSLAKVVDDILNREINITR